MSGLTLIIGIVSLTLCCSATMSPEKVENMETTTPLHMNVTPASGVKNMEITTQVKVTPVGGPKCGKPPEKENAFFLDNRNEETYPHSHTVTYTCRPGYVMSRRIKIICFKGKWEALSDGYCKKRSCGHPGDIPFGTFVLRDEGGFVFGAVVEYTCDHGYRMVSRQKTRTCAADGWTNQLPHCEARLCPPVMDDSVRILTTVTDDEFMMGHVINFKCKDPRRQLRGPSEIYCTEDGTWNMDPPTCNDYVSRINPKVQTAMRISPSYESSLENMAGSCTVQEDDMRKNNIQLKDNKKRHFKNNENVQFECVSGHKISGPTKLKIRCNSGILNYPTCNQIVNTSCGSPPKIKYGETISQMRGFYKSGSNVRYKCPHLYILQGPAVINCQGGTWDHPPICLEPCTTSEEKMRINNLTMMWNPKKRNCVRNQQQKKYAQKCYVSHNNTIKFTCLPGYKVSNPNELLSKCDRGILPYPTCFRI